MVLAARTASRIHYQHLCWPVSEFHRGSWSPWVDTSPQSYISKLQYTVTDLLESRGLRGLQTWAVEVATVVVSSAVSAAAAAAVGGQWAMCDVRAAAAALSFGRGHLVACGAGRFVTNCTCTARVHVVLLY